MVICIAIFLTLYIVNFLVDFVLDRLNIQNILKYQDAPPAPFTEHVPLDRYQKSIAYSQRYSKFSKIAGTFNAIIFLAFIYSGALNWLDQYLLSFLPNEIYRGLVFFAVLSTGATLISLPFSYYQTFVIEQEFGFNQQTVSLWVRDLVKSYILSLVLMGVLGYGVLFFMQSTGSMWWLYTWIVVFAFGFTLSKLYPVFIAPLFNKFTPLEEGTLRKKIEKIANQAQFSLQNIYVMDASTRSLHSNAYFAGFGETKRLVLYDSLLKDFDEDEITAVVAHEIGHYKKKHLLQHLVFSQATSLGFFYFLSIAKEHELLYQTFLVQQSSSYMGLLLLGFVCSVSLSLFTPVINWISWKFEYEADRYSYDVIEVKEAIKTLLIKLAEKNLSNLTPHPLYARFHYSHPPIALRISALGFNKE